MWRAATNQQYGDLSTDLAAPIIAKCLDVTIQSKSPIDAYHTISRMIALKGPSTIATGIAKRAAVNSYRKTDDRRLNLNAKL